MRAASLFEPFIIVEFRGVGGLGIEYGAQVVQHQVGAYDARLPEIGASGRGLAAVVVEDLPVANGGDVRELGVLGREFGQGIARADVDPRVCGRSQQVGLLEVDGDRGVRVVFRVDVFAAGVFDQAHHETPRRGHEPGVAVGRVEHHFRAGAPGCPGDSGLERVVACGDSAESLGTLVADVAQFGGHHQPFGLAQRRLFHIVPDIYIRNAQFAELARDDGVFARHAVEQDEVGPHGGQQFEVEVGVVSHVAHFAAVAVFVDVGVADVVDARNTGDAPHFAQGVEHGHVARRHADDVPHGGFHDLGVEARRGFGPLAQDEQVLLDVAGPLPGVADGDQGRGILVPAADVESRSILGRVDFDCEVCGGACRGASAAAGQEPGEYRYEKCESFH